MARRKKVVIVDQELTPTVLATVADKKKTSIFGIIWIIIIFGALVAGAYYLPELTYYVNLYINPSAAVKPDSMTTPNENKTVDTDLEPEQVEEKKEYELTDTLVIEKESITLSNFAINDNTLSLKVTNKTPEILDLKDYDYFLNLYNNKTLLQRIMLNEGVIGVGSTLELHYALTSSNVNLVSLVNIAPSEYPSYTVGTNGTGTMTCTKDNETIKYVFASNLLYVIEDVYEVDVTSENYQTLSATYTALASTYNAYNGITSNTYTTDGIFTFDTLINLGEASLDSISIKHTYPYNTEAKVIKFELEASGYTCK